MLIDELSSLSYISRESSHSGQNTDAPAQRKHPSLDCTLGHVGTPVGAQRHVDVAQVDEEIEIRRCKSRIRTGTA